MLSRCRLIYSQCQHVFHTKVKCSGIRDTLLHLPNTPAALCPLSSYFFDWRKQQQHPQSPGCAGGETPRSSAVRSRVRSASARLRKGIASADGSPGSASVPRELRENSQVPSLVHSFVLEVSLDDCWQCPGAASTDGSPSSASTTYRHLGSLPHVCCHIPMYMLPPKAS